MLPKQLHGLPLCNPSEKVLTGGKAIPAVRILIVIIYLGRILYLFEVSSDPKMTRSALSDGFIGRGNCT